MGKSRYFFIALIPICVSKVILILTSITASIIGVCVEMYKDSGSIVLDNVIISNCITSSFEKISVIGYLIGSCILILVFGIWITNIRKKGEVLYKVNYTNMVILFIGAIICQIIFYTILYKTNSVNFSVSGNAFKLETFGAENLKLIFWIFIIVISAISEQLLCRSLTIYYLHNITDKFWMINLIQALFIAGAQRNLIQGTCSFVLGIVMGWLFNMTKPIFGLSL